MKLRLDNRTRSWRNVQAEYLYHRLLLAKSIQIMSGEIVSDKNILTAQIRNPGVSLTNFWYGTVNDMDVDKL